MKVNKAVERAWDQQRTVLSKLYEIMTPGVEEVMSYKDVASVIGVTPNVMSRAKLALEDAGILSSRITYGTRGDNPGRTGHWKLNFPDLRRGMERLEAYFDELAMRPSEPKTKAPARIERPGVERVTIAGANEQTEVRAIAGDDADPREVWATLRRFRKNDSEALVEAARQYLHRGSLLNDRLAELEQA
jgi:hypothetical protein